MGWCALDFFYHLLISSRIPSNHFEHGREYHGYRKGLYMYPCDEVGRLGQRKRSFILTI